MAFVVIVSTTNLSTAQLFEEKKEITRADTLRGSLRPERECFDVTYYHLDIKVDPEKKYVSGYVEISFRVNNQTNRIQIDLFKNMTVSKIIFNSKELKFSREYNAVFIDFNEPLRAKSIQSILVYYNGNPQEAKNAPWDGGFTYSKDNDKNDWVAVSCQGTGASCWWPCKDHQSDEPDSMLISISCPKNLVDVSNGRLRNVIDLKDGYKQYNWFVANPINTYNVTLNIGNYEHWSDTLRSLSLDYYVLSGNLEKSKIQFEQVKGMLNCYQNYFGNYPWYNDGFKLVETPYLGMEHQSAIAYGNNFKNGYKGMSLSSSGIGMKFDYIIIHESAHEWWGNSITTSDIADMWVHEGFAMYAEALYCECMWGYDSYLKYINGVKPMVVNDKPIIGPYGVNEEGSDDMYYKGALMIHTIRTLINNDSLFFAIIKSLQSEFYHKVVTSQQIENFISKKSGMDLSKVFDQYLRHTMPPKIVFSSANDVVQYRWKADVPGFDMPIKIVNADGTLTTLKPTTEWQILKGYSSAEKVKAATDLYYVKVGKE